MVFILYLCRELSVSPGSWSYLASAESTSYNYVIVVGLSVDTIRGDKPCHALAARVTYQPFVFIRRGCTPTKAFTLKSASVECRKLGEVMTERRRGGRGEDVVSTRRPGREIYHNAELCFRVPGINAKPPPGKSKPSTSRHWKLFEVRVSDSGVYDLMIRTP